MKILVMGDLNRMNPFIRFHCLRCGCVFIENANECEKRQGQYNETAYVYDCPCCKYPVYSSIEHGSNQKGW